VMIFAMIQARFCPPAIPHGNRTAFGRVHPRFPVARCPCCSQMETMVELTPSSLEGTRTGLELPGGTRWNAGPPWR